MSGNPFNELFKEIKIDTTAYQKRLNEEYEAKLRSEREYITKRIRDANTNGLRKIRLEPHERLSTQTLGHLNQHCIITPIYGGYNPSTHDPMFLGWDIEW